MRTKRIELDVDYIGDSKKLTRTEKEAISNFINKKKSKTKYSVKAKSSRLSKITAQ